MIRKWTTPRTGVNHVPGLNNGIKGDGWIKLITLSFIALIATACSNNSGKSNQTISARAPVRVTHIQNGSISDSLSLSATTFYLSKSKISAPISGYLTKVNVQQGDKVKKGQFIFKMQTVEAQVLQSDTLSRLGNMKIAASSDGTILNVNYSVGDFVQKGGILAKMTSSDNLYLKLFVPFVYQSKINKNGKLTFKLPSGLLVSAVYTKTLSQANTSSQTVLWLFKPNKIQSLPGGLTFSVRVPTTLHKNTQILPKKAVLATTTLDSFWVMKVIQDSIAVKVPIKKGIQTAKKVEILSPQFKSSTKIIISGQYGLEDSTIVQIQNGGNTP